MLIKSPYVTFLGKSALQILPLIINPLSCCLCLCMWNSFDFIYCQIAKIIKKNSLIHIQTLVIVWRNSRFLLRDWIEFQGQKLKISISGKRWELSQKMRHVNLQRLIFATGTRCPRQICLDLHVLHHVVALVFNVSVHDVVIFFLFVTISEKFAMKMCMTSLTFRILT